MVSTLTVTATARLNGTVVQCRGITATETPTGNNSITVTGTLPGVFIVKILLKWYCSS